MLKIKKHGVILEPSELEFEKKSVLNPGIWKDGEFVHIFYRAIDSQNKSTIGYAKLKGPTTVVERGQFPIMTREFDYEKVGVEDPRIVKVGKTFYVFYVAHDGKNAVTAYATSTDLKKFKKQGIISPLISYREAEKLFSESSLKDSYYFFSSYYQNHEGKNVLIWEKDVFLFPKKINGQYALIHRILPDIQIAFFKNFNELTPDYWRGQIKNLSKNIILENKHWFESRNIGGGCPPLLTDDGWLLIFHTVEENNKGRVYHACAALLDKKNPRKIIARLHDPLFSPTKKWEKKGLISNVVFPTGTALFGPDLYIYYGAADRAVAVASVKLKNLIAEIKKSRHNNAYQET
ncbi:MAG: pesticidal protein Cry7Aa [Candidatus Doudnabacteria bacterium CG10_big_fil_rev_8_21_14_0_10_41_10]|uniref:Pesticidal protein Cry7Aa n=1 Tax=Candidatus Doudnabacteria bacterium CG10_big_fil_rev_8_21_14_0_10_41_10 TaxID=1974551 RepID=A0A2H0VEF1_9BACT|nr:MAG: pesticidal protein Cry7Aa [Candidatus Doudnabacteria bacterium CG10_big_fil_rev_8_21_14_0_10_41_10]